MDELISIFHLFLQTDCIFILCCPTEGKFRYNSSVDIHIYTKVRVIIVCTNLQQKFDTVQLLKQHSQIKSDAQLSKLIYGKKVEDMYEHM